MFVVKKIILIAFVLVKANINSAFIGLLPTIGSRTKLQTRQTGFYATRYVPDGLTEAEYNRIKEKDASKLKGKDLGGIGPRGFKSRSLKGWQEAFERGETDHTFAPVGYRDKIKKGVLKWGDIPYMVRGGVWDNSDVKGSKKKLPWSKTDHEYSKGGYKREQSVSILGSGPGFDWTGKGKRDKGDKRAFPGLS